MEAKDKAKELVNKFKPHADWNNEYGGQEEKANTKHAIQCALICVDEILSSVPMYIGGLNPMYKFYQEVKQELLNLK